jgi:hypothetical protein
MPSTSPKEEKTMRAIAHGWRPPAGSKVAKIPVAVAKHFAAADQAKKSKRQSLYDHSRKE